MIIRWRVASEVFSRRRLLQSSGLVIELANCSRRCLIVIRAQVLDVEGRLAGQRVLERARNVAHLDDLGGRGADPGTRGGHADARHAEVQRCDADAEDCYDSLRIPYMLQSLQNLQRVAKKATFKVLRV